MEKIFPNSLLQCVVGADALLRCVVGADTCVLPTVRCCGVLLWCVVGADTCVLATVRCRGVLSSVERWLTLALLCQLPRRPNFPLLNISSFTKPGPLPPIYRVGVRTSSNSSSEPDESEVSSRVSGSSGVGRGMTSSGASVSPQLLATHQQLQATFHSLRRWNGCSSSASRKSSLAILVPI